MNVRTTEPHYTWKIKAESVINIIKGKSKRKISQINLPKRVWEFSMVWGSGIYYRTTDKYGRPDLELLTFDAIYIYEWLEFELYDLVWFWNNQSHDTKSMLGQWMGLSHMFGSALCYCILSDKMKVLSYTTIKHLTGDEPKDPNVQ